MDVIILFLWSVAVHAFTGAYIRVVGFDDEGFHPDQFPLPKRFERFAGSFPWPAGTIFGAGLALAMLVCLLVRMSCRRDG